MHNSRLNTSNKKTIYDPYTQIQSTKAPKKLLTRTKIHEQPLCIPNLHTMTEKKDLALFSNLYLKTRIGTDYSKSSEKPRKSHKSTMRSPDESISTLVAVS